MCFFSGFGSVYTEYLFKDKKVPKGSDHFAFQNAQLYVFGILFNGVEAVRTAKGFDNLFQGITMKNFLLISLLAINGILIGAVQKHLDSIIKGYIYAFSSILVIVVSFFLFDYIITLPFLIGAVLVIFSVYTYNKERDLELSNLNKKPDVVITDKIVIVNEDKEGKIPNV